MVEQSRPGELRRDYNCRDVLEAQIIRTPRTQLFGAEELRMVKRERIRHNRDVRYMTRCFEGIRTEKRAHDDVRLEFVTVPTSALGVDHEHDFSVTIVEPFGKARRELRPYVAWSCPLAERDAIRRATD
jgi:hypothetical protein